MLHWIDNDSFEVDGCRFTIDITQGPRRRPSEVNNFTIVKTKAFLEIYEELAAEPVQNILELGIFQGGSIAFMDRLLKPRRIVGIDHSEKPVAALESYKKDNKSVRTYYGTSQDDRKKVKEILATEFEAPIDLVVDDASHRYAETKRSFQIIFPYVRPGGLYIIEDWAWYIRRPGNVGILNRLTRPNPVKFIYELVSAVALDPEVKSVTVHHCMVLIRKSSQASAKPLLGGV